MTDIGLTTVKVSNWDKTITTIPTYAPHLRLLQELAGDDRIGGRRIKRSVNIDMTSVRFLTSQEQLQLKQARLLAPYPAAGAGLSSYNQQLSDAISCPINGRHLTNLGTLRLSGRLPSGPCGHSQGHDLMVRQLAPTTDGLPLGSTASRRPPPGPSMKGYRLIFSTTSLRW